MNLKNNKGFTLIDTAIALVLLLIFIPTLGGIIYSIEKTDNAIKRKTTAVDIATDILEIAKSVEYDKVNLTDSIDVTDEFRDKITEKYKNPIITENSKDREIKFNTEDDTKTAYKINIKLINYTDTTEFKEKHSGEEKKDVVKKVTAKVEYPVGNATKTVDISTVLKKY